MRIGITLQSLDLVVGRHWDLYGGDREVSPSGRPEKRIHPDVSGVWLPAQAHWSLPSLPQRNRGRNRFFAGSFRLVLGPDDRSQSAKHFGIDVLFNPFLSVPIPGKFKKVMVMHNVEYHTIRNVYDWKMYTRWFLLEKVILPAADRVISISEVMTRDFARTVKYPIDQVRTIYHGVSERFRILKDAEKLREAKEEYCLPDNFILFVGHLYPQKNFSVLARAFALIAKEIPHDLVIAGRPRWKYQEDLPDDRKPRP